MQCALQFWIFIYLSEIFISFSNLPVLVFCLSSWKQDFISNPLIQRGSLQVLSFVSHCKEVGFIQTNFFILKLSRPNTHLRCRRKSFLLSRVTFLKFVASILKEFIVLFFGHLWDGKNILVKRSEDICEYVIVMRISDYHDHLLSFHLLRPPVSFCKAVRRTDDSWSQLSTYTRAQTKKLTSIGSRQYVSYQNRYQLLFRNCNVHVCSWRPGSFHCLQRKVRFKADVSVSSW